MNVKRSAIALSAVALGFGVAGCSDDDDDDIIEETVPGNPDLDPGDGSGLPGDEGDEGTTEVPKQDNSDNVGNR
jgi:hypothetical protein